MCCATLVSWALQNVKVMPDSAHLDGANNLAKKGYNGYQILKYFYANTKWAKINPEYYK